MFDIVSVGHFAIDSIVLPNRNAPFVVLGGSATYVSFAARRLDCTVSVISKVGNDFPVAYQWWLEQEGVNLSALIKTENAATTHFELEYSSDLSTRTLRLKNKAPPITIEDLPKTLKARAVHIAPIAEEVTYEVIEKLKACTEILSIDPQGLVRHFDENGNTTFSPLTDKRILGLANIFKASQKEIEIITGLTELDKAIKAIHDQGPKTVLVTQGAKGAKLSIEGSLYDIPVWNVEKFVDPTGAGDAFAGGFLAEYVYGENLLRCACVGAAVSSLVVEAIGPTFFGERETIYQRARALYEKEIKE